MAKHYHEELEALQLALVRTQMAMAGSEERVVIVLEGRDGAGKDGTIKRITEHLSVRATRVVALPKPSDRERTQWYFQRYATHLPAAGEIVIFNRSWYNRAGVEVVMGFSTGTEQEAFLRDAPISSGCWSRAAFGWSSCGSTSRKRNRASGWRPGGPIR
ncbi:hypothetical protein P0F65_00555 [Sphingomonas sp. I4]